MRHLQVFILGCTCAASAPAQVTYLTQSRQLTIATAADGHSETAAAGDFGVFEATLSHSVPFDIGGVSGTNSGFGFISCHFENGVKGRTRLRAEGAVGGDGQVISGLATTLVEMTFRLDAPSPFYVKARGDGVAQSVEERTFFRLSSTTTGQRFADEDRPTLAGQSLAAGTLPSGTYRFQYLARMNAVGEESDRDIRFEIAFAPPPCPADFNEDGSVDGSDVEAFFIDWIAGDEEADTNYDGGVDGGDIEAFFVVWEAGGC